MQLSSAWLGIVLFSIAIAMPAASLAEPQATTSPAEDSSVLDFALKRIDGTPQDLSDFRGRVLLIVNVASRCGYTPQYEGLEAIYDQYGDRGFEVLGFPSNDFRGQEPGTNAEIADFCRSTYGVEFPMFEKLHVKGAEKHPLYGYLTTLPDPLGGEVQWNFQKYLINRDGKVVRKFAPATNPRDSVLVRQIEALLDPES